MNRSWRGTWLVFAAGVLVGSGALAVTGALHPLGLVGMQQAASASRQLEVQRKPKQGGTAPRQAAPTIEASTAASSRPVPEEVGAAASPIEPPSAISSAPAPTARRDASRDPRPPRSTQGDPSRSVTAPGTGNPASAERGSWSEVAEAMQNGDQASIGRALDRLSQSGDAATRDAARLTRIQLQIAAGQADPVRIELEQLATSGATPLVRRRAREIKAQLGE